MCEDNQQHPELQHSLCTTIDVPLNHLEADNQASIELFVRKFPARKTRQGSIWLIAGGPGESGASFYSNIDVFQRTFPTLDILIPDHRGTGFSSSICPEESSDSLGGKALVGEEWGSCFGHMFANQSYVQSFTISNAAKDLALLINTMNERGKTYIYGVSYGTQLILRLLQFSQGQIDGVILDSLVPLQNDTTYELSQRSFIVNDIGNQLLKSCDSDPLCKTDKPIGQILSELLNARPMLSDYADGLQSAPLSNVLGSLLDVPHLRTRISPLVKGLANNDVSLLKQTLDDLQQFYSKFDKGYKNFGSSIPLVQVISSSENNLRTDLSKEAVTEEEKPLLFTSPLPKLLAGNSMPTYQRDIYFAKLPTNIPPTLVLHGTLGPKTHVKGAIKHVEQLKPSGDIRMVQIVNAPHYIGLVAPNCFWTLASKFVKQQALETKCREDSLNLHLASRQ
ncbi:alpha/beta fold hydrolase [Alteromonas sediminis]|uniref:Alpha/beta fold hydrolase n=1 Tax=Alteromonas sediminis TaxID=2259342 RepID=A0A3N5YMH6_9ALTE|nr:alpha/beta fold hydrolase [Alteromonas sediminis]RPJ66601.1 alpha/beta fold hydrolase [Alteromonas sediminis]